ncbi:NAD-binding protein [Halococcus thailandensis]|uniref:Kef-type transporter NAD-binding protein 2 n=1 Tax=Halococcus thailandensis JCM 13552 TaxID=1227457 RepID=M0N0N4_9EURY|nr:NAD-binding protein [Halococcus thailandensis]EMA50240.1 Kef-type transporter NAD-binding protein 2 [Halococcus thailandensis JCM 13552]
MRFRRVLDAVRTAARRRVGARRLRVLLGRRVAVWLTVAVALLSILTGVAVLGSPETFGPLTGIIASGVRRTAGFSAVITGFLLLISALDLRSGRRAAWLATVVLLSMTVFEAVVQSSLVSFPVAALSVATLVVLVLTRNRFDRGLDLSTTQIAALIAVSGALLYGTVGAYTLRESFRGVETLTDAVYYTIITASTVGYGDATPVTGQARLFTVSVIVVGVSSFGLAIGALVSPAIEDRLTRALGTMTDTQLAERDDHVLVLGYGSLTESVIDELDIDDLVLVVPEADEPKLPPAAERELPVFVADPTDDAALDRAGIDRARAVIVASDDDATDALAVLTVRERNPEITVVAAATEGENGPKLERAGADAVVTPAAIGGRRLVESALGEE